jgi:hypothetical protein
MQIWKMHLSRTQDLKGKDLKINTKEILKFAKEHYHDLKKEGAGSWNGRYDASDLEVMLRAPTDMNISPQANPQRLPNRNRSCRIPRRRRTRKGQRWQHA